MSRLFLAFPAWLLLSACVQSNPAQTKIYTPYGTMRYHCPPGHAMKGECYSPHAMPGQHHKHMHHK